jgi:hypothetical protein
VGYNPGNKVTKNIRLVVVSLDRNKNFAKRVSLDNVVLELTGKAKAALDSLCVTTHEYGFKLAVATKISYRAWPLRLG